MKFGFGPIGCRRPEGTTEGMVPIYRTAIELAERAEDVGFDSAWVAEHHFTDDGYLSSPVSMASAIAARTDAMEVGIGLAITPIHEPVRLAEDAAALNLLARDGGGSATLGLGLGYRDVEYEAFGVDRGERVGWLLDTVDACRESWSEGSMDFEGRVADYPAVDVTPKPGPGVQLVVGANASRGVERAGRIADGYIAPPGHSPENLDEKLDTVRGVLEEPDHAASFDVYHMQYVSVHPDGKDAAWDAVRDEYLYTRQQYLEFFSESSDSDLEFTAAEIENSPDRFEERWRSELIHGSPAEVADELARYDDVWHDVHTIMQLHYPGLNPDVTRRAVDLVGEEVIPELS